LPTMCVATNERQPAIRQLSQCTPLNTVLEN
jgi:hypothetical protein